MATKRKKIAAQPDQQAIIDRQEADNALHVYMKALEVRESVRRELTEAQMKVVRLKRTEREAELNVSLYLHALVRARNRLG